MSDINEKREELIEVAMNIILHAGDAKNKIKDALSATKEFDFDEAKRILKDANEDIRQAHAHQVKVIQNEASGDYYEASLLFNHAQDTLMTIMSEERLAVEIVELMEIFYNKMMKEGGN